MLLEPQKEVAQKTINKQRRASTLAHPNLQTVEVATGTHLAAAARTAIESHGHELIRVWLEREVGLELPSSRVGDAL